MREASKNNDPNSTQVVTMRIKGSIVNLIDKHKLLLKNQRNLDTKQTKGVETKNPNTTKSAIVVTL